MPTCRRKRVVLTEPAEDLVRALETDPGREVFYLEETGEIFETFEYVQPSSPLLVPSYLSRIGLMPLACPSIGSSSFSAR
jgi:hypothetical protein